MDIKDPWNNDSAEWNPNIDPNPAETGPTGLPQHGIDPFVRGIGSGLQEFWRGIKQAGSSIGEYIPTPGRPGTDEPGWSTLRTPEQTAAITEEGDNRQYQEQMDYPNSPGFGFGKIAGKTLPWMVAPGGKETSFLGGLARGGAEGFVQGALDFVPEGGNRFLQGAEGGLYGAGTRALLGGVSKVANAFTTDRPQTPHRDLAQKWDVPQTLSEEQTGQSSRSDVMAERFPGVFGIKGFREKQRNSAHEAVKRAISRYVKDPTSVDVEGANRDYAGGLFEDFSNEAKQILTPVDPINTQATAKELLSRYPDMFEKLQDRKTKGILEHIVGELDDYVAVKGRMGPYMAPAQKRTVPLPTISEMWELRKGIGDKIGQAEKLAARGDLDSTQLSQLKTLYRVISEDIERWGDDIGKPELVGKFKEANQAYKDYVVKYGALARAYEKATAGDTVFSPAKFARELDKVIDEEAPGKINTRASKAKGRPFTQAEKEELTGLANVLWAVKRAGQYMENPPTGNRWGPATVGAMVEGAAFKTGGVGGMVKTTMAAGAGALIERFLTTTNAGKQLAMAASKVEPNGAKMKLIMGEIYKQIPRWVSEAGITNIPETEEGWEEWDRTGKMGGPQPISDPNAPINVGVPFGLNQNQNPSPGTGSGGTSNIVDPFAVDNQGGEDSSSADIPTEEMGDVGDGATNDTDTNSILSNVGSMLWGLIGPSEAHAGLIGDMTKLGWKKPTRVYHGTTQEIAGELGEKAVRKPGFITMNQQLGTHFAADPEVANFFSTFGHEDADLPILSLPTEDVLEGGKNLYGYIDKPKYKKIKQASSIHDSLAIDNDIINTVIPNREDLFLKWAEYKGLDKYKAKLMFKDGKHSNYMLNNMASSGADYTDLPPELQKELIDDYKKRLMDQGYHGIKYTNTNFEEVAGAKDPTSYVVFDPGPSFYTYLDNVKKGKGKTMIGAAGAGAGIGAVAYLYGSGEANASGSPDNNKLVNGEKVKIDRNENNNTSPNPQRFALSPDTWGQDIPPTPPDVAGELSQRLSDSVPTLRKAIGEGADQLATLVLDPKSAGYRDLAHAVEEQITDPSSYLNQASEWLIKNIGPGAMLTASQNIMERGVPKDTQQVADTINDILNMAPDGAVDAAILKAVVEGKGLPMAMVVWHGSGVSGIRKLLKEKIGTGEGAAAFGHGFYASGREGIADWYRSKLGGMGLEFSGDVTKLNPDETEVLNVITSKLNNVQNTKNVSTLRKSIEEELKWWKENKPDPEYVELMSRRTGTENWDAGQIKFLEDQIAFIDKHKKEFTKKSGGGLYDLDIPGDDKLMHWDKPLSEQPEEVRKILANATHPGGGKEKLYNPDLVTTVSSDLIITGERLYHDLVKHFSQGDMYRRKDAAQQASEYLASLGIPGHRYPAGTIGGVGGTATRSLIIPDTAINKKDEKILQFSASLSGSWGVDDIDQIIAKHRGIVEFTEKDKIRWANEKPGIPYPTKFIADTKRHQEAADLLSKYKDKVQLKVSDPYNYVIYDPEHIKVIGERPNRKSKHTWKDEEHK